MTDQKATEERVDAAVARLLAGVAGNGNQNVTVKLEGGGRLGIAGVCCIVCLVCFFFVSGLVWSQAGDIRELRRDNQRLNDYLSAIYAQAPQLKPKESD
jgi:hypothetical protein